MADTLNAIEIARYGRPALAMRMLGWGILAILAGFLINNILVVGYDMPSLGNFLNGSAGLYGYVPLAVYVGCIGAAMVHVFRDKNISLRFDADRLHRFNKYIIRAVFGSVFFVGVVDATIAQMRVENLLPIFFNEDIVRGLGRSAYVGPYVHVPLIIAGCILALFTRTLGFTWLALLIVVAELLIVFMRFVFSYEQALMGDLVRYWYAALFLFASAYTLYDEGHVRVDILYAGLKTKTRGFLNAIGSLFLGITTASVILAIGLGGKTAIINAPVANWEITQTGSVGMFVKYQMAAFLAIFAITMIIQFVSYLFEAVADYREEPGHREHQPVAH